MVYSMGIGIYYFTFIHYEIRTVQMIKTVSLETAKALKEAGFKQLSYMNWNLWQLNDLKKPAREPKLTRDKHYSRCYFGDVNGFNVETICSAPTSDEILEELPWRINRNHYPCDFMITRGPKNYTVWYQSACELPRRGNSKIHFVNESFPEALAQMYLYLKKEGLI